MRIVGGHFKGKALAAPKSQDIRPTTDRVRETLFNILQHSYENVVQDARVLDLFSGTGALGIEALSRGASYCLFVDNGTESRGLIRTNMMNFGLSGRTRVFRRDATKLGQADSRAGFTLVFADPPYGKGLGEQALAAAADGGFLKPGTLAILEEDARSEIADIPGYTRLDQRQYGDTQIVFFRHDG